MSGPWDNYAPAFDRGAALAETDKILNLPVGFSAAQIQVESGGNAKARSPAGAMGLSQVMPVTLAALQKRFGRTLNPDDERDAVDIHREVMRENLEKFKDPSKALMAYNGGWNPATWGNPETSAYVGKVQAAMKGQQNPMMALGQKVADAIMPSAQAAESNAKPWEKYSAPATDKPWAQYAAPESTEPGIMSSIGKGIGNVAAGAGRGFGSIGATLLAPIDMAARAVNGGKPINVGGYDIAGQDRRAGMDAGLQSLGAEPDSYLFKGGKIAGEIAGTAGAGGLLAQGAARVAPAAVAASPRVSQALEALRTGGFSLGTPAATTGLGKLADIATRSAGGAVSGAAQVGLTSPQDIGTGAAIGAVAPGLLKAGGIAGNSLGRLISGPAQSADALAGVAAARSLGYVIPPTQAKPTFANRLLEGFSGKITTAQNASAKNAAITDSLAAKELGLSAETKITPEILDSVRKTAGQAYSAIGETGTITPAAGYTQALDNIAAPFLKTAQGFPNAKQSPVIDLVESLKSPSFDAASAVEKIKQLRTAADDAFRSGNTDIGRASRSAATALEDAVESHLQTIGQPELLKSFQDARQLIAKTYTVQKALNATTGTVDARKLGSMIEKGKPLSGGLRDAGEFANRFPKAAQTVEKMGSLPQSSPLDWAVSGGLSAATSNPLMLAGVMARPAARAMSLSNLVQNRLATPAGNNQLASLLRNPEIQQMLLRSAPIAGSR